MTKKDDKSNWMQSLHPDYGHVESTEWMGEGYEPWKIAESAIAAAEGG